jgi:hypothetical protein
MPSLNNTIPARRTTTTSFKVQPDRGRHNTRTLYWPNHRVAEGVCCTMDILGQVPLRVGCNQRSFACRLPEDGKEPSASWLLRKRQEEADEGWHEAHQEPPTGQRERRTKDGGERCRGLNEERERGGAEENEVCNGLRPASTERRGFASSPFRRGQKKHSSHVFVPDCGPVPRSTGFILPHQLQNPGLTAGKGASA